MASSTAHHIESQIDLLREQREDIAKAEAFEKAAHDIRLMHESFVDQGFTDEQAFELLTIGMKKNL